MVPGRPSKHLLWEDPSPAPQCEVSARTRLAARGLRWREPSPVCSSGCAYPLGGPESGDWQLAFTSSAVTSQLPSPTTRPLPAGNSSCLPWALVWCTWRDTKCQDPGGDGQSITKNKGEVQLEGFGLSALAASSVILIRWPNSSSRGCCWELGVSCVKMIPTSFWKKIYIRKGTEFKLRKKEKTKNKKLLGPNFCFLTWSQITSPQLKRKNLPVGTSPFSVLRF